MEDAAALQQPGRALDGGGAGREGAALGGGRGDAQGQRGAPLRVQRIDLHLGGNRGAMGSVWGGTEFGGAVGWHWGGMEFGVALGWHWVHSGVALGPFWAGIEFGVALGSLWGGTGVTLGSFWGGSVVTLGWH